MKRNMLNGWRERVALEIGVAAIFGAILWQQDAPAWTFTLLVLIATRASKVELHASLGYLQQTLQRRRASDEQPASEQEQPPVADTDASDHGAGQPIKRRGVGRWGQ